MCVNLQNSAVRLFNLCIQWQRVWIFFLFISFPQGLIHIRQIPRLNNLIYDISDVKDLAFKLKKKLFTIEVRENFYVWVHSLEVKVSLSLFFFYFNAVHRRYFMLLLFFGCNRIIYFRHSFLSFILMVYQKSTAKMIFF